VGYIAVEYSNNDLDDESKVLKTVDEGETWTELYFQGSTTYAGLQGIGFVTENLGWASGRGVTSMTQNGGRTWTQVERYWSGYPEGRLDGSVNRFYTVNDTLSVAVGEFVNRLVGSRWPRHWNRLSPFRWHSTWPPPIQIRFVNRPHSPSTWMRRPTVRVNVHGYLFIIDVGSSREMKQVIHIR
jgi:hypothetical protein